MANFWLHKKAVEFDDRIFLEQHKNSYLYRDLANKIDEYLSVFNEKGIKQGDIVAIISDYSFHSISLFIALIEAKCIAVPIANIVEQEIELMLQEAFVDWTIRLSDGVVDFNKRNSKSEKHDLIRSLQQEKQSGLVLFSSGSTGKPKAMIHNMDHLVDSFMNRRAKKTVILVFLMFDHIGGLNTLLNILATGLKMVLPTSREANDICALIEKQKVAVLPTTPTFLNLLLMSEAYKKYDLSSLKIISYGTEPMPENLLVRLRKVFKKTRFIQTFGTSETGISKTSSKSSNSTLIKIDDMNDEYKIVSGELWLRSKTQILGYLNHDMENFTKDGWFKTGDMVEVEEGYLRIIGRNKDIINVGGEKVLPSEVENILLLMPEVADCMVYAEKNAITGSTVAVQAVLNGEVTASDFRKKVRSFCKNKLAAYKIPSRIKIVSGTNVSQRFKKIRVST